jgi:hypothetical protein
MTTVFWKATEDTQIQISGEEYELDLHFIGDADTTNYHATFSISPKDQGNFSFNYVVLDPKCLSQFIADLSKMRDYYSELVKVQEDKEQNDE